MSCAIPLGTILTSFTLLRSLIEEKDPRVTRVLDRIDRNISRCDNIIEELLDYTRMREVVPQPTELDPWLRQLIEEQELPKALSVEWQLESSAKVPIDRDRMAQAVINVVQNACQAMSDADPFARGCEAHAAHARAGASHRGRASRTMDRASNLTTRTGCSSRSSASAPSASVWACPTSGRSWRPTGEGWRSTVNPDPEPGSRSGCLAMWR